MSQDQTNNDVEELTQNPPTQEPNKSNWKRVFGTAKSVWGGLNDEDSQKAEGDLDKLYNIIRNKFGDSKESIRTKLDKALSGSSKETDRPATPRKKIQKGKRTE